MQNQDYRISLADLSAAGVRLRPVEAVTIARDLMRLVSLGELPGVPSPHVIRITPAGALLIEGPVAAGDRAVSRAAQLLDALLPGFNAPSELRVPGAVRLAVARGLGTLDIPPYPNLEGFAQALDRFAAPDSEVLIRDLALRWVAALESAATSAAEPALQSSALSNSEMLPSSPAEVSATGEDAPETMLARVEPEPLTISDIRRARRATGLPLLEVSQRTRIPVALLRQLEWGYLRNWPAGLYGRTQLVRYARAAGLDEHLVVETVWPMMQPAGESVPLVVDAELADVEAPEKVAVLDLGQFNLSRELDHREPVRERPRRRARAAAGFAVAAAALLAFIPVVSEWTSRPEQVTTRNSGTPSGHDVVLPVGDSRSAAQASSRMPSGGEPAPTSSAPPPAEGLPEEQRAAGSPPERAPAASARPVAAQGLTEEAVAYSPAFAIEGSAMFYHADSGGTSALMRADTDGDGAVLRVTRVLDDHARNFHARPSPDGQYIAFDSDRDGERGVYVARVDGSDVRRVSGEGFAAVPSWSPDGGTLVFVRAEPGKPRVWNLWSLDLATGDMKRLTSHRYGQPWGGSWFPDGRRLAYSHEDRLIVMDLETGRQRVYPSPRKGQLVRTPAVSPDGRLVIFQVYRDGAWLLDLRDGSIRKVLADPSAEEYTWSPDGRRVAYHSRRSGEWGVWLMAAR